MQHSETNKNSHGMDNVDQANKPRGIWGQARSLAQQTPAARNRYVDFLRAVSILAVVLGHWIMAAPFYESGKPHMWHLLAVLPWFQWLTWLFQVMPIFFFVGGFSNATSWETAQRRGQGYGIWLGSRLQRLLGPVLPLLTAWLLLAWLAKAVGVPSGFIQIGSRIALVPTWFLAVYILVVLFVPLTHAAWKRYGLGSVVGLIAGAVVVDIGFFAAHWHLLGWVNYLFVWLAVHQLGYAWRDGKFASAGKTLLLFPTGIGLLLIFATWGPYPLSMVGVPTDTISNTLPPKLPLLALGVAQIGLLLSLEKPARRWLDRLLPWTGTVMVNGMIMTIFLWHSTVMMLIIGMGFYLWPNLFATAPGSTGWWALRPVWVLVFALATVPFLLAFSRFERTGTSAAQTALPVGRLYLGCVLTCTGLGYLALKGIGGGSHWLYDAVAIVLPFMGTFCAGFGPLVWVQKRFFA